MGRILVPILLCFQSIASAQNSYIDSIQSDLTYLHTRHSLENYIFQSSSRVNDLTRSTYEHMYLLIARELDFGYSQRVYRFYVRPIKWDENRILQLHASVVYYQDSIIYGILINRNGHPSHRQPFACLKEYIKNYFSHHNTLYKTNFDAKDFHQSFNKLEKYGVSCGLAGGNHKSSYTGLVQDYLENGDIKLMQGLLRYISPEAQAYGMLGLLNLDRVEDPQDIEIIKYLVNRETKIRSCAGCLIGQTDFRSIYKKWNSR